MIDKSWQDILQKSLNSLDSEYMKFLQKDEGYFPKYEHFLNVFKTLSRTHTKAILFGQDPYPREESAIGYAFIDGKVGDIFSHTGLSKEVNKATSLRNFIKMQLKAEGFLHVKPTQEDIANLPKENLIKTINELKNNFEKEGILLLNRALVFTNKKDTRLHVKAFKPFMKTFLGELKNEKLDLILFGNEAKTIKELLPLNHNFNLISTPHPYNISFIENEDVLGYFKNLKLMSADIQKTTCKKV